MTSPPQDKPRDLLELIERMGAEDRPEWLPYAREFFASNAEQQSARSITGFFNDQFDVAALARGFTRALLAGQDLTPMSLCPVCCYHFQEYGRPTLVTSRESNQFVCYNCSTHGSSLEFVLLSHRRWNWQLEEADAALRPALLVVQGHAIREYAHALLAAGTDGREGGAGGAGKTAPQRPRGPWEPRGNRPRELMAAELERAGEYGDEALIVGRLGSG